MPTAAVQNPVEHPSEHLVQNLATAVEGALWAYGPIRQTGTLLQVAADKGVVTLTGNIRSDLTKSIATRLARSVTGVTQVVNNMAADTEIEHRVAVDLAMDPDSQLLTDRINVNCVIGNVYLSGLSTAATLAQAEAGKARAGTLARQVPGVLDVVNEIRAMEGSADAMGAGGAEDAAASDGAGGGNEAVIQERLRIWRERAAAKG